MASQPAEVVRSERGAGDELEPVVGEARDGHVALDPAAAIEHLGVHDAADRAVDDVRAETVEERDRAGAVHVDLGEGRLVEEGGGIARRTALDLDRRRPVASRPAARSQRLVAGSGVRLEPVGALPARLLPEGGTELEQARVGRRDAQRTPRLALLPGVVDVVVLRVHLGRPREGVALRAVVPAEAADVHVPEVVLRLAVDDPLGHDLADAAGAGEPVRAEAGRHPEAGHLALAEDELAVGRERLGAVEEALDLGLLDRGHAEDGALHQLLEAVPVLGQELRLEALRDAVEPERRRVALVAAHHEPADLGAEVDEVVGIAQRRQAARAAARTARSRGTGGPS